jgi:predicted PolB exonuclease-like 3'-5' exonuclease
VSQTYLIFDLETVPDERFYTPGPADAEGARPFAPLYAQCPVVIGMLWLDQDYCLRRLWALDEEEDERGRLATFASFVEEERPVLVTFNGRGFDLPVVLLRSLHHGIALPWLFDEGSGKPEESHVDLCEALTLHGATRRLTSLDVAARLIGLPGKVGVDGSQVEALHRSGQKDALRRYCLGDVVQTAFLLLRYRLLQGHLPLAGYRIAARTLLQELEQDGQVAELLGLIDRGRLLGLP